MLAQLRQSRADRRDSAALTHSRRNAFSSNLSQGKMCRGPPCPLLCCLSRRLYTGATRAGYR